MDLMYIRTRAGGSADSGYLSRYEADFEISTSSESDSNDFEIKMPLPNDQEGLYFAENEISTMVFVDGTEYGGIITGSMIDIGSNEITYTGKTWRGILSQYIIEPPAGQDYRVVSGNLAASIRTLPLHPLMSVKDTTYSGGTYQFNRYITVHEGIVGLLADADPDLRLKVTFTQTDEQYTGTIELEIVKVRDLTSLVETSQDYGDRIKLKITRDYKTPHQLICLGQGELHEREVIHLYADDDWNVSQTPIAGAYPVETYDYSSSENLLSDGKKKYAEIIGNHRQIEVSISDLDVELGDIIAAKDLLTGESAQAEISSIIYKCSDYGSYKTESFDYKTKVRT